MTSQQTTQQFTPIILYLDLLAQDQRALVEQYLQTSPPRPVNTNNLTKDMSPNLHVNKFSITTNSKKPNTDTSPIIWLNQIDQPLGVEQWRDLLPQIQSTINNQGLIVAILQAETLSLATQNAMLKTLEEPPIGIQFLLASNRPTALLSTILSRCQLLRFGQNSPQKLSVETTEMIKSVARGSFSDALAASDQFKDREDAKNWILQTLVWSQQYLGEPQDFETELKINWPTWITALLTAHQQLEQNLHLKLVMDQLFLSLIDKQR